MSEETLFTAARRAIRDFGIDMNKGGLITPRTEHSMGILRRMVDVEDRRLKNPPPEPEPPEPEPVSPDDDPPPSSPAAAMAVPA